MPLKFPRGAKDEVAKNAIREYLLPENTLSGAKIAEKYGLTRGLFFDHLNKYRKMKNNQNGQINKNNQNGQNYQNYNYQNEQRTIKVLNKQHPENEIYKQSRPIQQNNKNNDMHNKPIMPNNNENESYKYTKTNNKKVPTNNNAIYNNEIEQINVKKNKPFERAFDVIGGYIGQNGRHKRVLVPE